MKMTKWASLFGCLLLLAGASFGQGQFNGGGGSGNATSLQGTAVSGTPPSSSQCLVFNGTVWGGGSCAGTSNTAFANVTGGTNTTAAMVVGAGASLTFSTTGTINASSLGGATFAAPGAIGGTTPSSAAFTTISATGQITSTVTTGTAPLVIASTTVVANLNASQLLGGTWASPGNIGTGSPGTGAFTTLAIGGGTALTTSNVTGTGNLVLATSPTLVTPTLGAATATTINKVTITAPATGSTLTIADGKTLTASNTLTFTGTDGSSVAFGAGGTVVYTTVTSLSSLATVGTITSGTWNATPVTAQFGGTGLATITAHGVMMGEGTGNVAASAAGTSGQAFLSGGASADGAYGAIALGGGTSIVSGSLPPLNGGTGLSNPTAHSILLAEGASNFTAVTSPSVNGNYTCGFNVTGSAAVDLDCSLEGIPINAQNTNYTLLYSDRASYLKWSGGTTATLTMPAATGNLASNMGFVASNANSGNLSITATSPNTIDGGSAGGSTTVLPNWASFVYQDSSANWFTIKLPMFAAFGSTCGDASHALSWSTTSGFGCQSITGSAAAGGSTTQLQYNNAGSLGGIAQWTTNGTTTITASSTGVLNMASASVTAGLDLPQAAGAAPTTDGFLAVNTTLHALVWGSNGSTIVGAAAGTGTTGSTTCSNQLVSAISSIAAPICSTVTGAMMASNTVTATQLAAQYSKGSCTEVWGGSGTSFALTSGDDAIANNSCYNDSGVTRTITAVKARSDNASNTTTVNPTFGSAGTGTTICSGALTAGNSYAYSSSCTVSNASWTTGTGIDPAMGGVLTGTSIAMIVEYTY